jgi:anti-anti-sigma regulatory factor
MLRITINDEPSEQRWILQGRLSGPWVAQLKSSWKKTEAARETRKCVVDLNEVTFVDLDGERVLMTMMKSGAELLATGVYTRHLVETLGNGRRNCIFRFPWSS